MHRERPNLNNDGTPGKRTTEPKHEIEVTLCSHDMKLKCAGFEVIFRILDQR